MHHQQNWQSDHPVSNSQVISSALCVAVFANFWVGSLCRSTAHSLNAHPSMLIFLGIPAFWQTFHAHLGSMIWPGLVSVISEAMHTTLTLSRALAFILSA